MISNMLSFQSCSRFVLALLFMLACPLAQAAAFDDTDGDGVVDLLDNCVNKPNGPLLPVSPANNQVDSDGDGYGNACDADLNNSAFVDTGDLTLFKSVYRQPAGDHPDADFNNDEQIDTGDLTIFKSLYRKAPGPSCTDNEDGCALPPLDIGLDNPQTDFKILMNYELGMHCTGFEFAYCCVLPVYNSILAQVVKPQGTDGAGFPALLEGDPNEGTDFFGRETVVRNKALDGSGNFKKYVMKYWHDAQPRNDGNGKAQTSTLISAAEGNSLASWNTLADSAMVIDGALQYGTSDGATGVLQGDGDYNDPTDNYQNAVWNHLYIYQNLEGGNPTANVSAESDKIRLGVSGQPGPFPAVAYPTDCGPAFHPLGPVTQGGDPNNPAVDNNCGGLSRGNVLTFSGDAGTVVFTQMKVLENLPIMLTSPDIWEALGLPLTAFEDTIDFFSDPGLVDEDSVRPYVAMKAQLYDYDAGAADGAGAATLDSGGAPVIGFGTAPIDIPNCERCHSNPADGNMIQNSEAEGGGMLTVINSPNDDPAQYALVEGEYNFWSAFYGIDKLYGDSDWYSRLKSAAISILVGHDTQHGTSFTANYPTCGTEETGDCGDNPTATRLGHDAVICQRCHADNVIAVVKSASCGAGNGLGTEPCLDGTLIMPISEAIHNNHAGVSNGGPIAFTDSLGRDGGCQGCHPAHRSDGEMLGYPITLAGANLYADGDNRGANGGCFVGRDVHSNPGKDTDGAETPEHLNVVGQWLASNVSNSPTENTGVWCTNCHSQLGQEIWKTENMSDLVNGVGLSNPRGALTMAALADAIGTTEEQAISWLDPKDSNATDDTNAIWAPDPGLCDYVASVAGAQPFDPAQDGNVAVVEVVIGGSGAGSCSNSANGNAAAVPVDCGFVTFDICGSTDVDGDFNVNLVGNSLPDAGPFGGAFCTTSDCVADAQASLGSCTLTAGDNCAVPVPMSAATDGRDHWLSPGEPHCADCHAAPYVEQSGNINAFPPFNYPRKASLMRYSRGHQDISCQGCHESIHGLYPVTPLIDTTSYAQAAALNHDGSHGPLKCGTCHDVDGNGIPTFMNVGGGNVYGITDYDSAVGWAHTYTAEANVLNSTCQNCHGVNGEFVPKDPNSVPGDWTKVASHEQGFLLHASNGWTSRLMMDNAETLVLGAPYGTTDGTDEVCQGCHGDATEELICDNKWKEHLTLGRATESAWETASIAQAGSTCGW